jgi:hypothetical protein
MLQTSWYLILHALFYILTDQQIITCIYKLAAVVIDQEVQEQREDLQVMLIKMEVQ